MKTEYIQRIKEAVNGRVNKADDFFKLPDEVIGEILDDYAKHTPQQTSVEPMTLEQAEVLSMKTDYAWAAVGEEINTGDAAAFFLEGYNYAQKPTEHPKPTQEGDGL